MANAFPNHISNLPDDKKPLWLKQRGWLQDGPMWKHPASGIGYNMYFAVKIAKDECRLPADFNLDSQ